MKFKNEMESWNVPPKSSSAFQAASVLFTPAHLCAEGGRSGQGRWKFMAVALTGNSRGRG